MNFVNKATTTTRGNATWKASSFVDWHTISKTVIDMTWRWTYFGTCDASYFITASALRDTLNGFH